MFNLEKSIADWRQQMLAAGLNTPVPLEELEMHLREEIEQLVRAGRTEPEAFESAVQRMGHAPVVHGEFKKISTADGKFEWLLMEIFFAIMGSVFPLWFCATLLNFKTVSKVDFPHEQQVSGLVAMGLYAGFIWAGRLGYKMLPVLPRKRQRSVLTVCCAVPMVLWWLVFFYVIVPRHDFTLSQFTVAFLWAFTTPASAMIGLLWGIEAAARKRTPAAPAL